jgi:hypothetical protein
MEPIENLLTGLAQSHSPRPEAKDRIWKRIDARVRPGMLLDAVQEVAPDDVFSRNVRRKVMARTWLPAGLKALAGDVARPCRPSAPPP